MKTIKNSKRCLTALILALCLLLCCAPVVAEDLPQLATPENLLWNNFWSLSNLEKPFVYLSNEELGSISWEVYGDCQNCFELHIYQKNEGGQSKEVYFRRLQAHSISYSEDPESREDHFDCRQILPYVDSLVSGTYYFTLQSLGDGVKYRDSEIAVSLDLDFEAPDAKLAVPTKLKWEDWPEVSWRDSVNPPSASITGERAYEAKFFKVIDGQLKQIGASGGFFEIEEGVGHSKLYTPRGDGVYYFMARIISEDISKYVSSDWSPLSQPYYYNTPFPGVSQLLTDAWDALKNSSTPPSAQAIRDAALLEDADRDELKAIILAEQDAAAEGSVSDTISKLETLTGVELSVEVTSEADLDIDPKDVSVVGARLNDLDENVTEVKLVVDQPATNRAVRSELYHDTVTTQFSMELDGVANTEELEVPVKITMPIPQNINPDFLVLLHYHVDGSYEILDRSKLNIFRDSEGGRWFVSFMLDRFSDFALTQRIYLPGKGLSAILNNGDTASLAICAYYGSGGSLLHTELQKLPADADSQTLTFNSAPDNTVSAKVFHLSQSASTPLGPAMEYVLTAE